MSAWVRSQTTELDVTPHYIILPVCSLKGNHLARSASRSTSEDGRRSILLEVEGGKCLGSQFAANKQLGPRMVPWRGPSSSFVGAVIAVILSACLGAARGAQWRPQENVDLLKERTLEVEQDGHRYAFCQGVDEASKDVFTGTTHNSSVPKCHFALKTSGKIRESSSFKVLVLANSEAYALQPGVPDVVPANAIPCEDADISQCFLGLSFYSDGICEEAPGKISVGSNMMYMTVRGKYRRCPFFSYLILTDRV